MIVHNNGDIVLSKSINECVNLCKVVHIVNSGLLLDSFPHNAKSNDLDAPLGHLNHVTVSHRGLIVKAIVSGQVVRKLHNDVGTVENPGTIEFVPKRASRGVNREGSSVLGRGCRSNHS